MRNCGKTRRYGLVLAASVAGLLALLLVPGCASEPLTTTRLVSNPFPHMTAAQLETFPAVIAERPLYREWFIRFLKADEAATN